MLQEFWGWIEIGSIHTKKIFLENAIMYTGCLLLSWHKQEYERCWQVSIGKRNLLELSQVKPWDGSGDTYES
jgi:hypothetical protein